MCLKHVVQGEIYKVFVVLLRVSAGSVSVLAPSISLPFPKPYLILYANVILSSPSPAFRTSEKKIVPLFGE